MEEIEETDDSVFEEIEETEKVIPVKSYEELERERFIRAQEKKKLDSQAKLGKIRLLIKKDFPTLNIEETIEALNKIKNNPQCSTCSSFYSQSSRTDIKNKIKGLKVESEQTLLLRIYKNSAEKLKDAKGYCCSLISPIEHIKTMIPVPDLSLCSDWKIHNNLREYIDFINQKVNKEKAQENKELEKKRIALEGKTRAEQVIKDYNKNYQE